MSPGLPSVPLLRRSARVPVGRRFLFTERRRAFLTVSGVAASLLLVLVLGGILAGAIGRVTHYIKTSPADLFVSQSGVRTMHMSASALPTNAAAVAGSLAGVSWAAPIGFTSGTVAGPAGRQLSYLIGYDTTTGHGGPTQLTAGRAPSANDEAVIDEQAADQIGVGLGDRFTLLGVPVRAVGFSTGGTSITNTTVFVDQHEFAQIRDDRVSYVLVKTTPDADLAAVAEQIRRALGGATVQTRAEFAESEARVVTDMSADLLRLMSTIGLLIALAVIALGLMTATLSRLRDFAVLKALGSTSRQLIGAVAVQVLWTVALAAGLATATALLLSWVLPVATSSVQIVVTPSAVTQVVASALAIGLIAALWPLRRIATLDAATAFRESL